eukprot:TRINITY_DN16277_c0_g2_i1.p1 TRINITY_DN16277_c0_g2~~TRINITY_DN16277_c0_g2_i1.p1  ORF type:complete len:477 (-),score=102.99 TRINITY_DN16277_c0_g2_i1:90-1520(-)
MRFVSSQMRKFASLFDIIKDANDLLSGDLGVIEDDLFSALLCGNHTLKLLAREFVTMEHELFPWILGPEKHHDESKDLNPMSYEFSSCSYSFMDTSKVMHDGALKFFPARETHLGNCAYTSSMWRLWKNFQTHPDTKGFVTSAGSNQMNYLRTLLRGIRSMSDIQIEIFYYGDDDLKPEHQKLLMEEFKGQNVILRDIHEYFDQRILKAEIWDIKPFVTLMSNATQVAYIDTDVAFFQNPEDLFNQQIYRCHGAQFFLDRTMYGNGFNNIRQLMNDVAPEVSAEGQSTRVFQLGNILFEMESGVVIIDKARRFSGLLGVCRLMDYFPRRNTYGSHWQIGGDKEYWWIGFEMMKEPYMFSHYIGGSVGTKERETGRTCGRLLHMDDSGRPLWMNGGYKYAEDVVGDFASLPWMEFLEYDDGGHRSEISERALPTWHVWEWKKLCLDNSRRGPRSLPRKYRDVVNVFLTHFKTLYETE